MYNFDPKGNEPRSTARHICKVLNLSRTPAHRFIFFVFLFITLKTDSRASIINNAVNVLGDHKVSQNI